MSLRVLRSVRVLATLSAIVELGIHLYLLNDHLAEKPYIGGLFIASAVVFTAVIIGLGVRGWARSSAYLLGAAASVVIFGSFIASRTVGLPLGYLEGWFSDDALGIPTLVFNGVFVGCAITALRVHAAHGRRLVPLALADRETETPAAANGQPERITLSNR
jgi:hypothetical protein